MSAKIVANLDVTVAREPETGVFVSHCPALDVYSQGMDEEQALSAIKSAVFLYLTTAFEHDRLESVLRRTGKLKKVPEDQDLTLRSQYVAVQGDPNVSVQSVEVPLYLLEPNAGNNAHTA